MAKTPPPRPRGTTPARRSWKGDPKQAAAEAKSGGNFSWNRGSSAEADRLKWMRAIPLAGVVVALLMAFVFYVFVRPRPTPLICAVVSEYEAPLAPQAYGQADVNRLIKLFPYRLRFNPEHVSVVEDQREDDPYTQYDPQGFIERLVERVGQAQPGGPNKDVVLVYLSLQSASNDDGEPCLMLPLKCDPEAIRTPAQTLSAERMVPLKKLIAALQKTHENARGKTIKKVVLLDGVRWDRHWRLGIAANPLVLAPADFQDAPQVFVVNSCSPEEIGLVDIRKGSTLFAEYVARGLWGQADSTAKSPDGKVTLHELRDYLRDKVNADAARREQQQQPVLYSSSGAEDFVLAWAHKGQWGDTHEQLFASQEINDDRLADINKRWALLEARQNAKRLAIPAERLVEREAWRQNLLRQEALFLAGSQRFPELPEATIGSAERLAPPLLSFPLALGALPTESEQQAWQNDFYAPPDMQPMTPLPYERAAWTAWQKLRAMPVEDQAAPLLERVRSSPRSRAPDPPELVNTSLVELRAFARFSAGNPHLPEAVLKNPAARAALVQCREQAEWAAHVAGEPRVFPFVREELSTIDAQRRLLEDRAFLGHLDEAEVAAVQERYAQARARAEEISQALALRDRVLADLPDLLEWATGEADRVATAHQLLTSANELSDWLDDAREVTEQRHAKRQGLVKQLSGARDSLLAAYRAAIEDRLRRDERHLGVLPEIEHLLASPLGTASQRADLWSRYLEILRTDNLKAAPVKPMAAIAADSERQRAAARSLLAHVVEGSDWKPSSFDPQSRSAEITVAQRQQLRRDLAKWLAGAEGTHDPNALLPPKERKFVTTDAAALRKELATLDRATRERAAWMTLDWGLKSPVDTVKARLYKHAILRRAQCDAHDYYLALAERLIDDFTGDDDGADAELLDGQPPPTTPYFERAARQLLAHAAQHFPEKDEVFSSREKLLSERTEAGYQLVTELAKQLEPAGEDASNAAKVQVPAYVNHPQFRDLPAGLASLRFSPDGWQILRIGDETTLPPDVQGEYRALQAGANNAAFLPETLQLTPPEKATQWNVDFYYRGHAGNSPLSIRRGNLIRTLVAAPPGKVGALTVNSPLTEGTVVILLDCSGSMEAAGLMKPAKNAVYKIINEMLATKQIKVKLVCFAHRIAPVLVDRDAPVIRLKTADPTGKTDFRTVSFENDVELVWDSNSGDLKTLKRLLSVEAAVDDKMQIQAMGYTPLYFSMAYALDKGFKDEAGGKQLIVISDGKDNVAGSPAADRDFFPQWRTPVSADRYEADAPRRIALARRALARSGATMHLLNIGAAHELDDAGEEFGVKPIDARSGALESHVMNSIGIHNYELTKNEGGLIKASATLKQEDIPDLEPGDYALRLPKQKVDQALRIRGDEHFYVQVRPGTKDPYFHFEGLPAAYFRAEELAKNVERSRAERDAIDDGAAPNFYRVGCKATDRRASEERDQTALLLAIHAEQDGAFSPRPDEVWAEVTPAIRGDGQGEATPVEGALPYLFCNPPLEPGQRVPMFRLVASQWPRQANTALVSVWFRLQRNPKAVRVGQTFSALAPLTAGAPVRFKFEVKPGELEAGQQVRIVEQHDSGKTDVFSPAQVCMVNLIANSPFTARREFYSNGRVEHHFSFAKISELDASRLSASVMPIVEWKKSAAGLDRPLVVKLLD